MNQFMPISRQDMAERKIEQLDFVYIIGDAYVDHPSFGHAVISRVLEANGFSVGIISQPDWKDDSSISLRNIRKYGFHGKSLYSVQKKASEGLLYARRRYGKTAGLRSNRIL